MIDFIIGLPPNKQGDNIYNAICIIVNRYTKMALYLPIVKIIIITKLINLFFNKILRRFGVLKGTISSYSNIFTSKF